MIDLPTIQTKFDADVASALSRFDGKLSSLLDLLISRISSVPSAPTSSTDVFDNAVSAFSVGIGDSTTGIYGDFVANLTISIETASQSINVYVSNQRCSTQSCVDRMQSQIVTLSDHISLVASDASAHVSDSLTNANDKFSSVLSSMQIKAAQFFINSLTDSYIGAIDRAELHAVDSIKHLVDIYNTYKTLPPEFYSDVNEILTEISTAYNDAINDANTVYNNAISSYKYYSEYSSDQISASQSKIKIAIDASTARLSALFVSVPSSMYNKADYIFSIVVCKFSSQMFDESIRARNQLDNLVSDLSKRAELTFTNIEKSFRSGYSPIFVDGIDYRNAKSSLLNGVSVMVSDTIDKMFEDYNARVSVISGNYNTYLGTVQSNSIEYINNNVPGLTENQISYINDKMSVALSRYVDRISMYFTRYSAYISYIAEGLSSQLKKFTDKYYTNVPLLRLTGDIVSPSRISKLDYVLDSDGVIVASSNVFKIGVSNIGGSPWVGWLGIRLSGSVEVDDVLEFPYFKWNKRSGYSFVSPGQSTMLIVNVPGTKIYNLNELGSTVVPFVIINTYFGGLKSLLR